MESLQNILGKSCFVTNDNVVDIMKRVTKDKSREPSSFYLLNIEEVLKRLKFWRLKMPRVTPHYAVKCNDHPAVLKTLALMGANFDCASLSEIKKVMSYGVKASRIIYAHPCKIASHLKFARNKGVKKMTFDSEQELYKIERLFPEAEILIRIRCDDTSAQCPLGNKFGVMPDMAMPLLVTAKQLKLNVVGIAFHVGSGCSQPSVFERAIAEAKRVFDEAKEVGHNPSIVDIGGGFLSGPLTHLDDAASYINAAINLHFPEESGVRVIAEPGRYMVASAFSLCTPIINYKDAVVSSYELPHEIVAEDSLLNDSVNTRMYFIDDGVYGSFNCVLYDHQVVTPIPLKKNSKAKKTVSSIWGPTCDGFDQVIKAMVLPEMAVGDWLRWDSMGAYTIAAAGQFNGFSAPEVKVFANSTTASFLNKKFQKYEQQTMMASQKMRSNDVSSIAPINGMAYGDYLASALDDIHVSGTHESETSGYSSDDRTSYYSSSSEDVEN